MSIVLEWPVRVLFLPVFTLALAACMGNEPAGTSSGSTAPASGPSVLTQESLMSAVSGGPTPLGLGCGWVAASDADKANIAFPDSAAKYWVAVAPVTPGTRLRIDGRFPDARYFSFNAYDLALRPTDAISDAEIAPAAGASNPFVSGGAAGGAYTAYLKYGASPTQSTGVSREQNTFYSGEVKVGPLPVPNSGVVLFIYRIYVSAAGQFGDGGVGLPKLSIETADGSRNLGALPDCAEPLLPNLGGALPALGLNERLLALDYPNALALDFPTATYPPRTNKFYGLGEVATQILDARTGIALPTPGNVSLGGGGFLSNIHNAYTTTTFARRHGSLALVRAKAPTYRSQPGVARGEENLRYWSLCGNEFATQRYTDCAADYQTPLDNEGYFTVVLSDPADRPANATAENGFLWLPWGPYPDQVLIYRHMLENPAFAQAIQRVNKQSPLVNQMGPFTPVGTYCNPTVFTQANQAKAVFEQCLADQQANPPVQVAKR